MRNGFILAALIICFTAGRFYGQDVKAQTAAPVTQDQTQTEILQAVLAQKDALLNDVINQKILEAEQMKKFIVSQQKELDKLRAENAELRKTAKNTDAAEVKKP